MGVNHLGTLGHGEGWRGGWAGAGGGAGAHVELDVCVVLGCLCWAQGTSLPSLNSCGECNYEQMGKWHNSTANELPYWGRGQCITFLYFRLLIIILRVWCGVLCLGWLLFFFGFFCGSWGCGFGCLLFCFVFYFFNSLCVCVCFVWLVCFFPQA